MNPTRDTAEDQTSRTAADGVARESEERKIDSSAQEKNAQISDKDDKSERAHIKLFGIRIPSGAEKLIYTFQDYWQNLRMILVPLLPKLVVNASARIIGVLQLTAEVLMLKSTGAVFVKDKSNLLNYIIQPPKVVYDTIFKKAQSGKAFRESLNPKNVLENFKAFTNLEQASKLDSLGHTIPLVNQWQARSSLGGILAGLASSVLPDVKESHEEVEAKAMMQRNNPIGYYFKCVGQALWFPAETVLDVVKKISDPKSDQKIGEHKRQFAGLAFLFTGISSVISGFRQVGGDFSKGEHQVYRKNPWHIIGGMITSVAGNLLMTGINNQQGWGNFGSTQISRTLILYPSISSRFKPGANGKLENNRWWYVAGQSVFQGKNMFASLVGGSEVKDDGTIDYHVEEKREAISSAKHEKMHRKGEKAQIEQRNKEHASSTNTAHEHKGQHEDHDAAPPSTIVSAGRTVQHAMPERAHEKQQEMAEARI